jgi:UDP-N-acetyl-D-mannosaminouronate:lipid I N-acetyl-D-mannosaminouronosyltransferase
MSQINYGRILIRYIFVYPFTDRQLFLKAIESEHKILIAVNAEKLLNDAPKLQQIINDNIGYADGVGTVMALRRKGLNAVKIPGSEFWLDIVRHFYQYKKFYLIGSTQEVIVQTVNKLKVDFPGINIVGFSNGFVDEKAKEQLKTFLTEQKPDIVFVAQGTPRQEYFMDELIKTHPALYMGLGGSFDIYCGLKKRAPKIFLNLNLEWFYRLLKEPTRFGRQLILIKFFALLLLNKL